MGASIFVYDPDGTIGMVDDSDPAEPAEWFVATYGVDHYPDSIYFFAEFALEPAKDVDMGLDPGPLDFPVDEFVWVYQPGLGPDILVGRPMRVYDAEGTFDPEKWAATWGTRNYPEAIYFFGPEVL